MSSFSFPKTSRLLNRNQFHLVEKFGKPHVGKWIRIKVYQKNLENNLSAKIGITVSKKIIFIG